MKKVELLCPAGNFDMLKQAIHNGADAVYLSGNKFGARKFANNFTNEKIIEAINYAHLYDAKVYITINTLIKDEEVSEFIKFVEFIHKNGVDAVLMQDLGMINLVRKTYPNLEIHASTQFHNHNKYGLEFLKSIGVKRAVLARELSINEIKELDTDIEKEVFVHGALCICYSGECLMSSLVMNRSGNRGECAGMCRLPYKLLENDKKLDTNGDYLLSPKELCTIENIKELLKLNIDSIKIEGRMKSPEYVGYVTKLYRKAIDSYYNNEEFILNEAEIKNLKLLYNREFTKGFLFNDKNIINQQNPNHQGIEIGKILDITKNKIKIKLTEDLYQNDAIRFKNHNKGMYINYIYDENNKLINKGKKGQTIYIDNKLSIKDLDQVLKTIDNILIKEINNYEYKKILINIEIKAKLNNKLYIKFSNKTNEVFYEGNIIEESKNKPTNEYDIIEKISKLGNSVYEINTISINIDNNIFIPISEINNARRILIENLNKKRLENKTKFIKLNPEFTKQNIELTNTINILIDDELDYKKTDKNKINFYTENKELYNKYKENNNINLRTPRIIKNNNYNNDNLLTNDIGIIYKNTNNNIITDIYSNVTNIYTIEYLHSLGIKKVGISPELSLEEINNMYNNYKNKFNYEPNIEIFTYGYLELMIIKHCLLKENINKNNLCNICNNKNEYYIEDRNKEKYKVKGTKCGNIIYNYKTTNYLNNIENKKGINYHISLINIKDKDIIKKYTNIDNNII